MNWDKHVTQLSKDIDDEFSESLIWRAKKPVINGRPKPDPDRPDTPILGVFDARHDDVDNSSIRGASKNSPGLSTIKFMFDVDDSQFNDVFPKNHDFIIRNETETYEIYDWESDGQGRRKLLLKKVR